MSVTSFCLLKILSQVWLSLFTSLFRKMNLKMQWHKAKVSNLQYGQSLEINKHKQRRFLKGGRDFEIKEMGRR